MRVNVGELGKRIQIMETVKNRDASGYWTEEDRVVRRCWARFTRTSGSEAERNNADMTDLKVRFLVRSSRTAIDRKMFVRYAGSDYDIVYVNDYNDDHQYTEIWCERRTVEKK